MVKAHEAGEGKLRIQSTRFAEQAHKASADAPAADAGEVNRMRRSAPKSHPGHTLFPDVEPP